MAEKTLFSISDVILSRIEESDYRSLSRFSCGCDEIDDVFHNELPLCHKYGYLVPYKCLLKDTGEIAGLFTLANDILKLEYEDRADFPNLSGEYADIFMRQPTYPAVNIGHLAVRKDLQSRGIGRIIVEFVRMSFSNTKVAGCQFVTVDALNNHRTLGFYQDKLGFEFQTLSDLGKHTRRMYLDIFTEPSNCFTLT